MLWVAGSGKSTQSQLLTATGKYRWVYIGEVLRRTVNGEDAEAMRRGELLNDDKVISYLKQEIDRIGTGPEIIIDGFPRSRYQADWLVNQHKNQLYRLSVVVHIEVPRETVLSRLKHRGRPDDTATAITLRFKEYDEAIQPIITDLKTHNVPVIVVNGEQEPLDVFGDICKGLKQVSANAN
jgi:adenylate kinase